MTVPGEVSSHSYYPGAAQKAEALTGLIFFDPDDLDVYRIADADGDQVLQVRDVHFAITGDGSKGAGKITAIGDFGDDRLWVERTTSLRQQTDFVADRKLPIEDLERGLDKSFLGLQDMRRELGRAPQFPRGVPKIDFTDLTAMQQGELLMLRAGGLGRPDYGTAAGKYAAFSADGRKLVGVDGALPADVPALAAYIAENGGGTLQDFLEGAGYTSVRRIDLRAFRDGVGIGNEGNDTAALHAAWVEAATQTAGPTTRASALRKTIIQLPAAELLMGDSLLTDEFVQTNFDFAFEGQSGTRIKLTDEDAFFIDSSKPPSSGLMRNMQITGGAGAFMQRFTTNAGSVSVRTGGGYMRFENLVIADFKKCAIGSNEKNDPNWQVLGCHLVAAEGDGFAPPTRPKALIMPPGSNIYVGMGTYIFGHTYGIVMRGGGKGMFVDPSVRFGGQTNSPRYDYWIVPDDANNRGPRISSYHGAENDSAADHEILIADGDTSGNPDHATAPTWEEYDHAETESAGYVLGLQVDGKFVGTEDRTGGLIKTYTQNFFLDWRGVDDGNYPYLVEFGEPIAALSSSNFYIQRSTIHGRNGQDLAALNRTRMKICNLPGFGMVMSGHDVFLGDQSVPQPGAFGTGERTNLLTETMADMVISAGALGALSADDAGGIEAREIDFAATTDRATIRFDMTNAVAGKLAWVEVDLKRAAASALTEVVIGIGSAYNQTFQRQRTFLEAEWTRVRIPFLFPATAGNFYLSFRPPSDLFEEGVSDRLLVGRPDAYHAPAPVPLAVARGVSADNGNASKTLKARESRQTQLWATDLDADRTVTLSTAGAWPGATFRIVRTAGGAFNLDVGGLKTLAAANTWAEVEYNGTAWVLTASGDL